MRPLFLDLSTVLQLSAQQSCIAICLNELIKEIKNVSSCAILALLLPVKALFDDYMESGMFTKDSLTNFVRNVQTPNFGLLLIICLAIQFLDEDFVSHCFRHRRVESLVFLWFHSICRQNNINNLLSRMHSI